jgi:hypothetical protein
LKHVANKLSKKDSFKECFFTGTTFDGSFSPLRLGVFDGKVTVELSDKHVADTILITPEISVLNGIIKNIYNLPECFQNADISSIIENIKHAYEKRFYSSLAFLLKARQAVIGRRAIERALQNTEEQSKPIAILLATGGSKAICESFKRKKPDLKIFDNFSLDMLKAITGREKISFYCVLNGDIGKFFLNDYVKYLKFCR